MSTQNHAIWIDWDLFIYCVRPDFSLHQGWVQGCSTRMKQNGPCSSPSTLLTSWKIEDKLQANYDSATGGDKKTEETSNGETDSCGEVWAASHRSEPHPTHKDAADALSESPSAFKRVLVRWRPKMREQISWMLWTILARRASVDVKVDWTYGAVGGIYTESDVDLELPCEGYHTQNENPVISSFGSIHRSLLPWSESEDKSLS
eukprot:XP_017451634.1 PREDICTED: uncharacterized protein LOC102556057 isoform X1 [Rattus norvegicus]